MIIKKLNKLLSKREKRNILLILGASILVSFLETFGLSLIMVFASVATNFDLIFTNKYYSYGYNLLGCKTPAQFIIILGLGLICFYFFRGVMSTLFTYTMNRFSQGRYKNFAFRFFQNYLNFKYKDFTASNSSKLNKVIFGDPTELVKIITGLLTIAAEGLTIFFIYSALIFVHWKMTMVLTVLLTVKIFFIIKAFSGRLERAGKKTHALNIKVSRVFGESFWNFKIIKLLSNERHVLKKFDDAASGLVRANTFRAVLQNSPRVILETIGFSLLISVIVYVVYMYNNVSHIIPIISMYAFAFYKFLPSINKILSEYNNIVFGKYSLDAIQNYLTYELEDLGDKKIEFTNQISLKKISFSYDDKNKILADSNLVIKKGQRTAFVGESGAGKSTIVDIIMGLYRPEHGQIFIDDVLLTKENIRAWRGKIGYIPQQIYLFDGTVAENIVFGRVYDEEKIIQVLKQANIYDFLSTQNGIDSKIGEGGINVSGGQKQRIAIARALYSDPDILVLDEATSALDNQTEEKIMNEIYGLNLDKTLIIVAHRLSTVERCDVVYKVENQKVTIVDNLNELYKVQNKDQKQIQI